METIASERLADKRAALDLTFRDNLEYSIRPAKTTSPFNIFGRAEDAKM
jgi:hypothetical protein